MFPESHPHWALILILTTSWLWSSLGSDSHHQFGLTLIFTMAWLSSKAWDFRSPRPDLLSHSLIKLVLTGHWHCCSLTAESGPHYLTLVLSGPSLWFSLWPDLVISKAWHIVSLWLWSLLGPDSGPHTDWFCTHCSMIFIITRAWTSFLIGPDSHPHFYLTHPYHGLNLYSVAWHFGSLSPDSLPHWVMNLVLSGDWHCSSLGSDFRPHYSLTLVLTMAWLSFSLGPDSHAH